MHTEIGVAGLADTGTPDERWAAWAAKGVEEERKTRKRAIAATALVGTGLGLWIAVGLLIW